MSERDTPPELHTEADNEPPLSSVEAEYMGTTVAKKIRGVDPSAMLVYGEVDGVENEDQYDAHHADEGEHL
jgi:hypothetical protein